MTALDALCRTLWRVMNARDALEAASIAEADDAKRQIVNTYFIAYHVAVSVIEAVIKDLRAEEACDGTGDNPGANILQ